MKENLFKITSVVIILVMLLLVLTGCGTKVAELDMAKINPTLSELKSPDFDIYSAESNVLASGVIGMETLEMIYDFDFEAYGIDPKNIQEYRFNMNKTTKDMWAVFLPVEGKKDMVKGQMDSYIKKLASTETDATIKAKLENVTYTEMGNYLIYVVSDDNAKVIEAIKSSKRSILPAMMPVTNETLKERIGINPEEVQEYAIQEPMMIVTSSTYLVIKPAKGKKEVVKEAVNEYMAKLDKQWSTYLPAQHEIIKNRMEKEYGDYLIYIATEDNQLIYDTIIKTTK